MKTTAEKLHTGGRGAAGKRMVKALETGIARVVRLSVFSLVALLAWTGVSSAATEVTTCGQVVSGSAFLSADLDCSTSGTDAVVLAGGKLDLRGFTITGDSSVGSCGVLCTRSCKVISTPPGGTITGALRGVCDDPFGADVIRLVHVQDVVITGVFSEAILAGEARVKVVDSTISNNGVATDVGSSDRGRLRLVNSTVTNNANGVTAFRAVVIRDSVISGNTTFGAYAIDKVVVKSSQITGNGTYGAGSSGNNVFVDSVVSGNGEEGIAVQAGDRLKVVRTTIDGNGSDGVFPDGVSTLIRDSVITNNGGHGISGLGDTLKVLGSTVIGNQLNGVNVPGSPGCQLSYKFAGSTLTGNGTDASCGVTVTCADIASCAPPSVAPSACDTSYDTNSGFPGLSWGVCALD